MMQYCKYDFVYKKYIFSVAVILVFTIIVVPLYAQSNIDFKWAKVAINPPISDPVTEIHQGSFQTAAFEATGDQLGNTYLLGYLEGSQDTIIFQLDTVIRDRNQDSLYLAKYNYDGDFQWVRFIGDDSYQSATNHAMEWEIVASEGKAILFGWIDNLENDSTYMALVEVTTEGTILPPQRVRFPNDASYEMDSEGGLVISGRFHDIYDTVDIGDNQLALEIDSVIFDISPDTLIYGLDTIINIKDTMPVPGGMSSFYVARIISNGDFDWGMTITNGSSPSKIFVTPNIMIRYFCRLKDSIFVNSDWLNPLLLEDIGEEEISDDYILHMSKEGHLDTIVIVKDDYYHRYTDSSSVIDIDGNIITIGGFFYGIEDTLVFGTDTLVHTPYSGSWYITKYSTDSARFELSDFLITEGTPSIGSMNVDQSGAVYICGNIYGILGLLDTLIDHSTEEWTDIETGFVVKIDYTSDLSLDWYVDMGNGVVCNPSEQNGFQFDRDWLNCEFWKYCTYKPKLIPLINGEVRVITNRFTTTWPHAYGKDDNFVAFGDHCIGFVYYTPVEGMSYGNWNLFPIITQIGPYSAEEPNGTITFNIEETLYEEAPDRSAGRMAKYLQVIFGNFEAHIPSDIELTEEIIETEPNLWQVKLTDQLDHIGLWYRIKEVILLDENQEVVGKMDVNFNYSDYAYHRDKEVIIILHNDLVSYQDHPVEGDGLPPLGGLDSRWIYPQLYRYEYFDCPFIGENGIPILHNLYQTSMLVPPVNADGSYLLENIRPEAKPVLFVHGITGMDPYWGTSENNWNSSYSARTQKLPELKDDYDIWEFYYPPDQSWIESGYLLGVSLRSMLSHYGSLQNPLPTATIIAHSMGGLVTRSYVENKAYGYMPGTGDPRPSFFFNDVDKVLFLGTPNNGAFTATRAYWGIHLKPFVYNTMTERDVNVPGHRTMTFGSEELRFLNDDDDFNNNGVIYLNIAGTDRRGRVPNIPYVPLTIPSYIESFQHDDGVVAVSSSSLLDKGIPLGLLRGFSHTPHISCPDCQPLDWCSSEINQTLAPLTESEKMYIPKIISDFLRSENGEISNEILAEVKMELITSSGDFNGELIDGVFSGAVGDFDNEDIRVDIGLPIITISRTSNNEDYWKPKDSDKNIRFRLNITDSDRDPEGYPVSSMLIYEEVNGFSWELVNLPFITVPIRRSTYTDPGMYLYYSENNFDNNDFKEKIDNQAVSFYGYQRSGFLPGYSYLKNPLSRNSSIPMEGMGIGWHIPETPALDIYTVLGIIDYITIVDIFGIPIKMPVPTPLPNQSPKILKLRWCETSYSNFEISPQAEEIVRSNNQFDLSSILGLKSKLKKVDDILSIPIDNSSMSFSLIIRTINGNMPNIELIDPSDDIINASMSNETTIFYSENQEQALQYFTIVDPDEGNWGILINGQPYNTESDSSISVSCFLNADGILKLELKPISDSDSSLKRIEVFVDDSSIITTSVATDLIAIDSTGHFVPIEVVDDGTGLDLIPNDNIFTGFLDLDTTLNYTLRATMTGLMNGSNFIRTATEKVFGITYMTTDIFNNPDDKLLPNGYDLQQNYPNPFNPTTTIEFTLPVRSHVAIDIYNLLGQRVKTLFDGEKLYGPHSVVWDGTDQSGNFVATGIYFYQIRAGDFIESKKMLLLK